MKKVITSVVFLVSFVVAFYLSFTLVSSQMSSRDSAPKRIIVITIDTLRADHLTTHGYPVERAPFLRSLADRGITFTHAYSQIPHTAPSHASMFTGLFPFQHGLLRNHEILSEEVPSLHTVLKPEEISTVAFPSVKFLDGKVGFPTSPLKLNLVKKSSEGRRKWYLGANGVIDNALQWLNTTEEIPEKFVLWLHFYDVHQWAGWGNLPKSYREAAEKEDVSKLMKFIERDHGIDLSYWKKEEKRKRAIIGYDARLKFVNDQIERFYKELEKRKLTEDSVWIITSDHGEGLGNHNFEGHGEYLYQEQLHVPFVIYSPEDYFKRGLVRDEVVRLVDIFPTVIDLFGHRELTPENEGISLTPLLTGPGGETTTYSFAQRRPKDDQSFRKTWEEGKIYAVQDRFYKYIHRSENEDQFYNLESDPKELQSLPEDPLVEEYDHVLKEILSRRTGIENIGKEPELSEEELDELKSLGYL